MQLRGELGAETSPASYSQFTNVHIDIDRQSDSQGYIYTCKLLVLSVTTSLSPTSITNILASYYTVLHNKTR